MRYEHHIRIPGHASLDNIDEVASEITGVAQAKVDLDKRTLTVSFELGAGESPEAFGYWLACTLRHVNRILTDDFDFPQIPEPDWATDCPS